MANPNAPTNAFPTGNQFYKQSTNTGRPKLFTTPEDLLMAADCYFDWVENNPLTFLEFVNGHAIPLTKMRAMSLQGLSTYLGVCNLRYYKKNADFSHVIDYIQNIIFVHNFEGAAAGLLKPNIIARSLRL